MRLTSESQSLSGSAERAPSLISADQALAFLLERARAVSGRESVAVADALGRVLAGAQRSPIDVPGYANSQMDGYAVRAADAVADGETRLRVTQRIAAGVTGETVGPGEAARIFTGAPLPEGADAVVIQEDCRRDGDMVAFRVPVRPGENVRPRGNDIVAGSEVLAAGTRVRPQEMGLAASLGLERLEVVRRPRVAIFSSGDELLAPGERLRPGTIYNSNRFTLTGLLCALGCEAFDLGTVADTAEATRAALVDAAARADVVVTSGGMSVGEEDHVKRTVEEVGEIEMWQVAVKPGKPLAYGRIGDADFLGLPGNPVSTLVTFCLFVRPFLLRRLGVVDVAPKPYAVCADFRWREPGRRREYARARLVTGEDATRRAVLYPKQGSDVLTSSVWADGLVEIREGRRVEPGDIVPYLPFAELLY